MRLKIRNKALSFCLLILMVMILPSRGFAAYDEAWDKYITGHKKVQVKTHHHLALKHVEMRPLLDKSQELQLALADEKSARFYYLLENHPERINRKNGFTAFVNFDWTLEDEQALLDAGRDYRKLHERTEELTGEVEKHKDWEQLQAKLLELADDVKYREIISRFRFIPKEVEEVLNRQ